jgi:hypothetical protein
MKKIVFALAMTTLAACGTANNKNDTTSVTKDAPASVDLAGKKYCRMVVSDGLFGQPAGQREHCIKFIDGQNVSDNSSTFFGNPPEQGTYAVSGKVVTLTLNSVTGSYNETYTLSADAKSITGTAGAVLTLKAEIALADKEYCRMVATGGLFGQPAGQREHCIKFIDGQKVSDNGSTFFGNPPEQGTYAVSGKVVTLTLNSVTGSYNETYTLSADGKSITGTAGAVLNLKN